jgi:hypothetical protein
MKTVSSGTRLWSALLVAASLVCAAPAIQAQPAKYKAIWEPVNYPDDFNLRSVYFANDRVGWVGGAGRGGKGGIILYTADAGETVAQIEKIGRRAFAYPASVDDFAQCEQLVERAIETGQSRTHGGRLGVTWQRFQRIHHGCHTSVRRACHLSILSDAAAGFGSGGTAGRRGASAREPAKREG